MEDPRCHDPFNYSIYDGSKNNLLIFSNIKIRNKKTNAEDPNGKR